MSNRLLVIARHPVTRVVLHCAALCTVQAIGRGMKVEVRKEVPEESKSG
ncbi:hypothetical protein [Nocardia cyriacigeorgica]|uniref:Uncharacterized protein n=1 Tax=Nocardia cyriacigeorgica TaxID=135487 RepID=A0A6P1D1M3_9NOCA|nr:hypothetical protein [Nocardia cyriacigeorgica]NEW44376.1 hypothetical protein [Nocardia cyriacigeorgica]